MLFSSVPIVNPSDYRDAYQLIRTWGSDERRDELLEQLRHSDRRGTTLVGLILIAALLAKCTKVSDGFVEQLTRVNDADIALGVLNITDQILAALDADDDPDNEGYEVLLDTIPDTYAFRDIIGHQDESGARDMGNP